MRRFNIAHMTNGHAQVYFKIALYFENQTALTCLSGGCLCVSYILGVQWLSGRVFFLKNREVAGSSLSNVTAFCP